MINLPEVFGCNFWQKHEKFVAVEMIFSSKDILTVERLLQTKIDFEFKLPTSYNVV